MIKISPKDSIEKLAASLNEARAHNGLPPIFESTQSSVQELQIAQYLGNRGSLPFEHKLLIEVCLQLEEKHPTFLEENSALNGWWKSTKKKHEDRLRVEENQRIKSRWEVLKIKVNAITYHGGIVPEDMQNEYDLLCAQVDLIKEAEVPRDPYITRSLGRSAGRG